MYRRRIQKFLKRVIYHVDDMDRNQLDSFEIPELQREVYNIIMRYDYDIDTYNNEHYKKLLQVKARMIVFPLLFSMERTVLVHDINKLRLLFKNLDKKYEVFFQNLDRNISYFDSRPFVWGFADSLFHERHNQEYYQNMSTLKYNWDLYKRVLREPDVIHQNENDGGFGLLHFPNDRIATQHYVKSNGNKKTDSKQNNPLDYITGKKLNSSVKQEKEVGIVEYVRHFVQHYDIEQDSFCIENEKMWFNYFKSRFRKNFFKPLPNGNISQSPYTLDLSLVFKKIIYNDPSNMQLVDENTLLCHHIPSLDKITKKSVLEDTVEKEKQFLNYNHHHHLSIDFNDFKLQDDQYQLMFETSQNNLRHLLLNSTVLKDTYTNFKYNRLKDKQSVMVTIHEDEFKSIRIYFFRNHDNYRNFSINGDISLNIFIFRKSSNQITLQSQKRQIQHEKPQKNIKRSRQDKEHCSDGYISDDNILTSEEEEEDSDDSSYRPGSSDEDSSISGSSNNDSGLCSDDFEVIEQYQKASSSSPYDDDGTMVSSLTGITSYVPSPSPVYRRTPVDVVPPDDEEEDGL